MSAEFIGPLVDLSDLPVPDEGTETATESDGSEGEAVPQLAHKATRWPR